MRFLIFGILLCLVFFRIGWLSNEYRNATEPIVKRKTNIVCFLSPLQIETLQKNSIVDISCADDSKSAQTMEISIRKEKYKNIIQVKPTEAEKH
jgi:hypothetical protein